MQCCFCTTNYITLVFMVSIFFLYLQHQPSFFFFASSMISIFLTAPVILWFIEASSIFFLHHWRCGRFPRLFVVCWRLHVWPWWSLHGQVWFEHFVTIHIDQNVIIIWWPFISPWLKYLNMWPYLFFLRAWGAPQKRRAGSK